MEKTKVGEYVRTKKGIIAKVQAYQELKIYGDGDEQAIFKNYETDKGTVADIDILKHSSNIIDLIEENDVIKFWYEHERVSHVYKTYNGNLCVWNGLQDVPIKDTHIISILTKEQFEAIEYRLED